MSQKNFENISNLSGTALISGNELPPASFPKIWDLIQ